MTSCSKRSLPLRSLRWDPPRPCRHIRRHTAEPLQQQRLLTTLLYQPWSLVCHNCLPSATCRARYRAVMIGAAHLVYQLATGVPIEFAVCRLRAADQLQPPS